MIILLKYYDHLQVISNTIWVGLGYASHTHGYATILKDLNIYISIEILYMKTTCTLSDSGCAHFARVVYAGFDV